MRSQLGEPLSAILEAVSSVFGWSSVIVVTLIVGFCAGYWIGHGQITAMEQTLGAFAWIPLLWLGNWEAIVAYIVTVLALYLPLRFEPIWLKTVAATTNLLTWLVVVHLIVVRSSHAKFWHY